MASARLHCAFVLLLYLQGCYGQAANNQNIGVNNMGIQQQALQRGNNINQIPNGGLNINLAQQQSNLQSANLQASPAMSAPRQGNLQQPMNLPPYLQSQTASMPPNNFQITKIGFTPVSQIGNPSTSTAQTQNQGIKPNVQVIQNIPNSPASLLSNSPISTSTLAELVALKGQPSLLSLLNPQSNANFQQNQQVVQNTNCNQNQMTDMQKQFLMRALQTQSQSQNAQTMNYVPTQQNTNMDYNNQQAITIRAVQGAPQQAQAIVTPLGNQPPYITVQAQPLSAYLQNQNQSPQAVIPQTIVDEDPIMSMILSELGPQYAVNSAYPATKKSSKSSIKGLIPIILNLLKERNNCGCTNCGCPNNTCQNNACPNPVISLEPQIAQIFGGYSNQKTYGQGLEDSNANKKKDAEETKKKDKDRKNNKKPPVKEKSVEYSSEEDDSEYIDDE